MTLLPDDSLVVLAWWAGIAASFAGIGAMVARVLAAVPEDAADWLDAFWTGLAVVLAGLQLWHLVFPVDGRALVLVACAGATGLALNARVALSSAVRALRYDYAGLALFLLGAAWLAERALIGAGNGDSGLYHVPTIRWLVEYPVVPGLGNLHSRLAFNQSYFLYVAMLDVGAFAHRSSHLANSLLVLAAFASVSLAFGRILLRRRWTPRDLFFALCLPAVVPLALDLNLTSPSPDLAVFVLGLVLGAALVDATRRPAPPSRDAFATFRIALLAAAGVTMKLSMAMLAAVSTVVVVGLALRRRRAEGLLHVVLPPLAAVALLLLPWVVRGVVWSGYPLFPSPVGALPLDWAVPVEAVRGEYAFIRVWPGSAWDGLGNPAWLVRFLESMGWKEPALVVPVAVAAVAAALFPLAWWLGRRRAEAGQVSALVCVPVVASLVFWFLSAPRPRFAGAALWLLAIVLVLLVIDRARPARSSLAALVVFTGACATAWALATGDKPLRSGQREFSSNAAPRLSELRLASGLVVRVPENHMCWNAPLPCTPFVRPGLSQRRPGDLGSGFRVDASIDETIDGKYVDPATRTR